MIIVSQNKKEIVNFNNVIQILITYCAEDDTGFFIRYKDTDGMFDDLGEYKTEERAKEVLQEIVSHYYNYELTKVYTMPEE